MHRAKHSHDPTKQEMEAQQIVQDVMETTGGPGLCSTRTKVCCRSSFIFGLWGIG
jgi:hypothetical protein